MENPPPPSSMPSDPAFTNHDISAAQGEYDDVLNGSGPAPLPSSRIDMPIDLIRLALDERVFVKMRGDRELKGRLHVFFFILCQSLAERADSQRSCSGF